MTASLFLRIDPARSMGRHYRLDLLPDLFAWGRSGRGGQAEIV